MVDFAIKVLAVIAGIVFGVIAYPELNKYMFALLAVLGAVAVGIIAGALVFYGLSWLLSNVKKV